MRKRNSWLLFIVLLVFVGLACEQSGRILTPEDATAEAGDRIFRPDEEGGSAEGAEFEPGSSATVVGSGFLINLLDAPGGRIAGSQGRGSTVEIIESAEFEGEIWYHVNSGTGDGWLKPESLEAVEEEEGGGESEGDGSETASGLAAGDTVYLIANGFLVNLLNEPNGTILAFQERGVPVSIEDVFEADDGGLWYLIDAPAGEGWVPADNISVEAP